MNNFCSCTTKKTKKIEIYGSVVEVCAKSIGGCGLEILDIKFDFSSLDFENYEYDSHKKDNSYDKSLKTYTFQFDGLYYVKDKDGNEYQQWFNKDQSIVVDDQTTISRV